MYRELLIKIDHEETAYALLEDALLAEIQFERFSRQRLAFAGPLPVKKQAGKEKIQQKGGYRKPYARKQEGVDYKGYYGEQYMRRDEEMERDNFRAAPPVKRLEHQHSSQKSQYSAEQAYINFGMNKRAAACFHYISENYFVGKKDIYDNQQ